MNPLLASVPLVLPCVLLACRLSPTVAGVSAVGAAVLVVLLTGVPIDWPSLPEYLGITAEVLFILLNGMILARLMQISGAMRSIGNWVSNATPGIGAGTAFVVFGVVPFVECVTGFGIGVTVGVPILITLGHKPAKAALFGLLGLCAVPWGALAPGTAVASSLTGFDFTTLGVMSGWYNSVVLVVVALTVAWGTGFARAALPTFASAGFLWGSILVTNMLIGTPLAGVIGSALLMGLSLVVYRMGGARIPAPPARELVPYAVLAGGLLCASVVAMLVPALEWLALPPVWLAVACVVAYRVLPGQSGMIAEVPDALRSWVPIGVSTGLFMILGWVMAATDMSTAIGEALSPAGAWPGPLLGAVGSILTGSNTASNAMFAPTIATLSATGSLSVVAAANVAGSFMILAAPPRVLMAVTLAGDRESYGRTLLRAIAIASAPPLVGAVALAIWL
ncbi:lactate permease [Brevibacterium paucivorans]|uniref:L-lactate permease n=1 Tax=Brevibacterium paucivorans TaxID=170994 RepID=A0ABS2SM30_9MICO|nr:lactate permease [Brevibacterium paucivorans]